MLPSVNRYFTTTTSVTSPFSSDGRYLVTVAVDATTRFWEARTARAVGEPLRHNNIELNCVVLTDDGRFVVTGSAGGAILTRPSLPTLKGAPRQMRLWSELITGQELDNGGGLRILDAKTWRERTAMLKRLGGIPKRSYSNRKETH